MTRVQTACRANPIIRDLARRTTLSDGLVTRVQTACRANPIILAKLRLKPTSFAKLTHG